MSTFSRILVGTDGSQAAEHAVDFAAKLAHENGSEMIVCHFVNWIAPMAEAAVSGALTDPAMIEELRAAGDEIIERAKQRAKTAGVVAQGRLLDGAPASGILGLAGDEACTLIVVATHNRSGFEHFFVGSTTAAVLRGSTIPVLTLRAGEQPVRSGRSFEHIIVGIDDSEPSDAALATVIDFPVDDRRCVQLVGVASTPLVVGGSEYHQAALDELHEETERVIDAARATASKRGCVCEGRVVDGRPATALVATAEHEKADLIVLGSHGRRGLRRLFIGSVAESVVESSPIPVLVVRGLQKASVPVRESLRGLATVSA
jgi:nucleotide-binding universal stress UspA family protein